MSTSKPTRNRNSTSPRLATSRSTGIDAFGKMVSMYPGILPSTVGPWGGSHALATQIHGPGGGGALRTEHDASDHLGYHAGLAQLRERPVEQPTCDDDDRSLSDSPPFAVSCCAAVSRTIRPAHTHLDDEQHDRIRRIVMCGIQALQHTRLTGDAAAPSRSTAGHVPGVFSTGQTNSSGSDKPEAISCSPLFVFGSSLCCAAPSLVRRRQHTAKMTGRIMGRLGGERRGGGRGDALFPAARGASFIP